LYRYVEDLGIPWVILGHSERRTLLGEDNTTVGKKVGLSLASGVSDWLMDQRVPREVPATRLAAINWGFDCQITW
jgi:antibiotic biosynthesis monooxygenase (ABM) superfamily enzyme